MAKTIVVTPSADQMVALLDVLELLGLSWGEIEYLPNHDTEVMETEFMINDEEFDDGEEQ